MLKGSTLSFSSACSYWLLPQWQFLFTERRAEHSALPPLALMPEEQQMIAVGVMVQKGEPRKSLLSVRLHICRCWLRLNMLRKSSSRATPSLTAKWQTTIERCGRGTPFSQGFPPGTGSEGAPIPFTSSCLDGRHLPKADTQKVRPFAWGFSMELAGFSACVIIHAHQKEDPPQREETVR